MANTILVKRSAIQGKVPLIGDLALGEIAVNTFDGRMYIKSFDSITNSIIEVTGKQAHFSQDTAPAAPRNGDEWFDTTSGVLYSYHDDGVNVAWIEMGSIGNTASSIQSITDLIEFSNVSGTGVTAILSTISTPTVDQVLTWDGTNWVNQDAGGAGDPSLALTHQAGFALTTTLTDAGVVIPANTKGIIRSILVTNISAVSADMSAEIVYGALAISLGDVIPIEPGSGLELVLNEKVLAAGDVIKFLASANASLHATIIWEETADLTHLGGGLDITVENTLTDLYTAAADSIIKSVLVANDSTTPAATTVQVVWTDGADVIQGYYAYEVAIPAKATVEMLTHAKRIPAGHKIRFATALADHVEIHYAAKTV